MRTRRTLFFVLWTTLLATASAWAQWESIQTGFDLGQFTAPVGDRVFVTRMALDDVSSRTLDSTIAQGQFYKVGLANGGREVVSSMVSRYNDTIGYYQQKWGSRYDIVAAVNGDYWERQYYPSGPYTGRPTGGQVLGGWYCRRFPGYSGGSGFFYTVWGVPHLGGDVWNGENSAAWQTVTFADNSTANLTAVNLERTGTDDLVVYTPQWGPTTYTDNSGIEVLAQVNRPCLPFPPGAPAYSSTCTILEVNDLQGSTPIPFDCVILSATGTNATTLRNKCVVGQTVRLYMTVRDYGFDSRTPPMAPASWEKAYGSIGVDREILVTGQVTNLPSPDTTRRARTALAHNGTYVFLIVVEETTQNGTRGMTFQELAEFMRDTLQATYGCSVDGGGSSCMWVKGRGIVNNPSDGAQRATCNGVFLAHVLPKEQTTRFPTGQTVRTTAGTDMRLGPGTVYSTIATLGALQTGTIESHSLNGVRATGQNWWKCTIGSSTGWVTESTLEIPPPAVVGEWLLY